MVFKVNEIQRFLPFAKQTYFPYTLIPSQLRQKAFTDDALELVSQRLTKDKMKFLARELDIEPKEVKETYAKYCPDEKLANFELLSNWLNNQQSREKAYVKLGDALIRIGLQLVTYEVLGYFPAKQQKELKSGVKRKNRNGYVVQRKKLKKCKINRL